MSSPLKDKQNEYTKKFLESIRKYREQQQIKSVFKPYEVEHISEVKNDK